MQPANLGALYLVANMHLVARRSPEALSALGIAFAHEYAGGRAGSEADTLRLLLSVAEQDDPRRLAARMPFFAGFGTMLAGAPVQGMDAVLATYARSTIPTADASRFGERFSAAAAALGFQATAPREWNRAVFEQVMLPWMRQALAAGRYDNALTLESVVYQVYVKQTETEAHFQACFAQWKDDMRAAGQRFAAALPPVTRAAPGPLPRVAFFVHNVTPLAHVQMLLTVLEGHALLERKIIEPSLFYLEGKPDMIERFRKTGAVVESLMQQGPGYERAFALLRQRIAERGIDQLAWISLALEMPFAFGMRLAPTQTWWAMKYHALETPDIDNYVTGGSQTGGSHVIADREWRVGPVAASDWFRPELADDARRVRESLPAKGPVYGSFGREEKLNSPPFLDAVADILRRQPDAVFLWTGRVAHPEIQERFAAAGVAGRCRFIGWVNTKLYAQVIDIFLDSFPFPCGFTLYEAMAAGKPVVLFDSSESTTGGINALVAPLLAEPPEASEESRIAHEVFRPAPGTDYYYRLATPEAYADTAVQLGEDAALRERAGAAARAFVERLMGDPRRAASIYLGHLVAGARRGP